MKHLTEAEIESFCYITGSKREDVDSYLRSRMWPDLETAINTCFNVASAHPPPVTAGHPVDFLSSLTISSSSRSHQLTASSSRSHQLTNVAASSSRSHQLTTSSSRSHQLTTSSSRSHQFTNVAASSSRSHQLTDVAASSSIRRTLGSSTAGVSSSTAAPFSYAAAVSCPPSEDRHRPIPEDTMRILDSRLITLRKEFKYLRQGKRIWSNDHISVCNAEIYPEFGKYTVVAVRLNSLVSLRSEVAVFCQSLRLNYPVIQRGVIAFQNDGEICFAYDYCETDLLQLVEDERFLDPEVQRGIFRALNYIHNRGLVHNNLVDGHKIVVTRPKSKNDRWIVKLTGFGERTELVEDGASRDYQNLAHILENLCIPKDEYFASVLDHLRCYGCRDLDKVFHFLNPNQRWEYLSKVYDEVKKNQNHQNDFYSWSCTDLMEHGIEWDWIARCKKDDQLEEFYEYSKKVPYCNGAYQFLRFCRNVAEHFPQAIRKRGQLQSKMTSEDLLQRLVKVWPAFFVKLHMFCAKYNVVITWLGDFGY